MSENEININSEIINRCKQGDVKAQFILYKQYSKSMYNIAIRILNNKMDAEDILQESFVTVFDKVAELTHHYAFGSWLKKIVVNNCLTHLRKRKFVFDDIENYPSLEDKDDGEEELIIDPAIVHNAIKELPSGSRTILVLHALEGYKHREIAVMLDVSESTCRTQYKRALDLLQRQLNQKIYVS